MVETTGTAPQELVGPSFLAVAWSCSRDHRLGSLVWIHRVARRARPWRQRDPDAAPPSGLGVLWILDRASASILDGCITDVGFDCIGLRPAPGIGTANNVMHRDDEHPDSVPTTVRGGHWMAKSVEATRPEAVDSRLYRDVIGGFATGVAVITAELNNQYYGMTANSLTSVSLDPTLLLVAFNRASGTLDAVTESGEFVVNLLDDSQSRISNHFARPGDDLFAEMEYELSPSGIPILHGGLGYLECRVDSLSDGGDHMVVFGEIVRCEMRKAAPLLFYRGGYGQFIRHDDYPVTWWC